MESKVFDDIYEKAKSVVDATAKKTSDMVEISKLKIEAAKVERAISSRYEELGSNVYLMKKGDDYDEELVNYICTEIDELKDTLAELKGIIADKRNMVICPECGAKNAKGSIFCSKCGDKLTKEAETTCEACVKETVAEEVKEDTTSENNE